MASEKLTPLEWKERYRMMREHDRAEWREHWPALVVHGLFTLGGGFVFGVALGFASSVYVWMYPLTHIL